LSQKRRGVDFTKKVEHRAKSTRSTKKGGRLLLESQRVPPSLVAFAKKVASESKVVGVSFGQNKK